MATKEKTGVRPFTIEVPEADLQELRARIAATRWPDKETVEDQSQGPQLATLQELARYWLEEYDWRKCESALNAVPNFITEIDGLDIHFIHARSKHDDALPLIVCHGCPVKPRPRSPRRPRRSSPDRQTATLHARTHWASHPPQLEGGARRSHQPRNRLRRCWSKTARRI
jgi:hypothetical protein